MRVFKITFFIALVCINSNTGHRLFKQKPFEPSYTEYQTNVPMARRSDNSQQKRDMVWSLLGYLGYIEDSNIGPQRLNSKRLYPSYFESDTFPMLRRSDNFMNRPDMFWNS